MNLELTTTERRLLLTALLRLQAGMSVGLMQADIDNLATRVMDLVPNENGLHLPLEAHGTKGAPVPNAGARQDEQLSGGVSSGRTQGGDQSQCVAQSEPGKFPAQDRWAKNVEAPDKDVALRLSITPCAIEVKMAKNGECQIVTWQNQGRGYLKATCFQKELFPWIASRKNQLSMFYAIKKGAYTNIIGVRA